VTSNNHVQAEALAAWAEGRLAAAEAATVETHLASCALCQATLAVFARTEPQDVESGFSRISPERSGFSWFRWRWAVPVAAAATAAAIWVAVPDNTSQDEFDRTVASAVEERAAAPSSSASADAAAPRAEEQAKPLSARRDQASSGFEDRADKQEKRAASANEAEQDLKAEASQPAATAAAPAPEAPAASAPDQARLRTETLSGLQRQAPMPEVVSPDPLVRWRIVPPGRLERSTDGGKTWAPVPLPQPVDVIAVRAPTATSAIATAADGRQFRTDDQGKTWNPVQP
jgi:hypothetical protein